MRTGTSLFLIAVGAILRFAVVGASPLGLNVHITGVILILVGILGMTLPRVARASRVQRVLRTPRAQRVLRTPRAPRAQRFPHDPRAQRVARDTRVPRDRLRRWVRPGQVQAFGEPFCAQPAVSAYQPAPAAAISLAEDPPTLLDDILSFEHPLL
jgi:hypothetical protein